MAINYRNSKPRNPGTRPVITVAQAARASGIANKTAMTILGSLKDQAQDLYGVTKSSKFFTLRRTRMNGHLYASNPVVISNESDFGKSYGMVVADVNRKTLGNKSASGAWLRPFQRDTYNLKGDALKAAKERNDDIMSSFCEALADVGPDVQLEFSGFHYYTMLMVDGEEERTILVAEVHSVLGKGIGWTSRVTPEEDDDVDSDEEDGEDPESEA